MISPEIYMAKTPFERSNHPQRLPAAPVPAAKTATDGVEDARQIARMYLPDSVRLLASIALSKDSEAALHTRMLCAKEIVAIAGVIPQPTPAPPEPYDEGGDGRD
jgi:hypothetical protein